MDPTLFDTKEKVELALANFKTLRDHPGWIQVKGIVDYNIKLLEEQILYGVEDETKEQIDRKRDKLKAYKDVISTPDYWISQLEPKKPQVNEDDPYDTVNN
jgi:hypothetical protein